MSEPATQTHAPRAVDFPTAAAGLFPPMVILTYSNRCNAECPHCPFTNFESARTQQGSPFMPVEVFRRIADEAAGHPHSILRITGTGEPFVNTRLVEDVEYAARVGARVGIITNGSLVTEEKARRLLEAGLCAIEFSVDAHTPEIYREVRVGLDFDRTVQNARDFVALRNRLGTRTVVMASLVVQPAIEPHLEEAVAFWRGIVDHVMTRKFLTWERLPRQSHVDPYLSVDTPCPYPFDRAMVDTLGNVSLCGYDILDPKRNEKPTNFGNVMHTSLADLWRHPELERIRGAMKGGAFGEIPMCRDCNDRVFRSWTFNYFSALQEASRRRAAGDGGETLS